MDGIDLILLFCYVSRTTCLNGNIFPLICEGFAVCVRVCATFSLMFWCQRHASLISSLCHGSCFKKDKNLFLLFWLLCIFIAKVINIGLFMLCSLHGLHRCSKLGVFAKIDVHKNGRL